MKNDKSQFVVRTSDFYLSLVICHLTEKSSPGCKGFFFAKSSRSWRSSRLRGESWAGLSPRRREAREENAKDGERPHNARQSRARRPCHEGFVAWPSRPWLR